MFNPPRVAEWQWLDESCGLWYPWYTIGALEEISKWDLKDKRVVEYGGGRSSLWWAQKAYKCTTIEANVGWAYDIVGMAEKLGYHNNIAHLKEFNNYWHLVRNNDTLKLILREVNEGDQSKVDYYTYTPEPYPDIVVVDGILRYECILRALSLPRPLTLIVDNYMQSYVFMCPAAEKLLKDYEQQIFIQHDHINHDGHPWKTAIFHLK